MLDRFIVQAGRVSRLAVWVGGAAMMLSAFVVTFDVLARKLANWSLQGADELSGYIFAFATAWAFAFALLERANVRIDGFYLVAPVPLKATMDIAALLALGAYVACMLNSGWVLWLDSYEYGARSVTPWRTPLALPQGAWLIGWVWFGLVLLLVLLRALAALARRDLAGVVQVAGVRTMDEEVRSEIAQAEAELAHERRLHARAGER